jgi:hypothetical protein
VLFGGLVERRFGRVRLFVNAENLGGVRQTRFDPLRPSVQAADGRWTVDAWAPLDGRGHQWRRADRVLRADVVEMMNLVAP